MPTLSYDFEADTAGTQPSGWAILDSSGTVVSQVYNLGGDKKYELRSSSYILSECSDVSGSLDDVLFSAADVTLPFAGDARVYLRHVGSTLAASNGYLLKIQGDGTSYKRIYVYSVTSGSEVQIGYVRKALGWTSAFSLKFEVTSTTVRSKVWVTTDAEPAWDTSVADTDHTSGTVVVGSSSNSTSPVYLDDISIESDDINIPTNVTPTPGTAEITGYDPYVSSQGIVVQSGTGNINYNKDRQHTVKISVNVTQSAVGEVEIAGYDPVVGFPINVAPIGNINIAGYNPTVVASASKVRLFFKFKDENGFVWTREIDAHPPVTAVSATYIASSTEETILADATAGAFDVTMPTVTGRDGYEYTIKKVDSSANAVTVKGTIDGDTDFILEFQHESITIAANSSGWWIK